MTRDRARPTWPPPMMVSGRALPGFLAVDPVLADAAA